MRVQLRSADSRRAAIDLLLDELAAAFLSTRQTGQIVIDLSESKVQLRVIPSHPPVLVRGVAVDSPDRGVLASP